MSNVAYRGSRLTIEFAVLRDGTLPGRAFLEEQESGRQANIYALFTRLADAGRIDNREKFKKIEGSSFWEFKSFQVRMPCYFRPDQRVVITHGFTKKGDRIKKSELSRAESIKSEYEGILASETN